MQFCFKFEEIRSNEAFPLPINLEIIPPEPLKKKKTPRQNIKVGILLNLEENSKF